MRFRELDELVAWQVADKAIPSISYVLFDARDILARGSASLDGTLADNALFRIGSISKTFAAILAIQLVERGRLAVDDEVSQVLPGFSPTNPFGSEPITLRRLLSHRSGLTREASVGHYLDGAAPPLSETVAALSRTTLKAPSDGSAYFYSNAGFALVGGCIERATKASYADALQANILDPLGLANTAIAATSAIRSRLAPAKMWSPAGDTPAPIFDLGSAPAGNIFASLSDIVRFAQSLLRGGGGVISPASLAQMWTAAGPNPAKGYGLGFSVDQLDGRRMVGHGGVVYGYASTLQLLLDAELGVVVFSTLDVTNEIISRIARYALRLALAERGAAEHPRAPRRLAQAGHARAAGLAGHYIAEESTRSIELRGQDDCLLLIDDGVPYELRPIGNTHFVLDGRLVGEDSSYPHLNLQLEGSSISWGGRLWHRTDGPPIDPTPTALVGIVGSYGPQFLPTLLFTRGGKLMCLMEGFFPHACESVAENRYILHGGLYEQEALVLGLTDASGRPAIRVGEMTLSKVAD